MAPVIKVVLLVRHSHREVPVWRLEAHDMIHSASDPGLVGGVSAPVGTLEEDKENSNCPMSCSEIVRAMEIILKYPRK